MIRTLHLIFLLAIAPVAPGQENRPAIVQSMFFIGDAGEPYIGKKPVGSVLRKYILRAGAPSTVVFLGDNVYPAGLSDAGSKSFAEEADILREQVSWTRDTEAKAIFIPGNHDWQHWGEKGLQYVKNQQTWFDSLKNPLFSFFPRENCPGPVEIAIPGPNLLVIIDSQWFLHEWEKPGEDGHCPAKTAGDAMDLLAGIFARHPGKRIIVAAHHPLITYGDHGGVFTLKDHLFPLTDLHPALYIPLPVVGSLYPWHRKQFPHLQDTGNPVYRSFSAPMHDLLKKYPGSVYVAGHEHALQYIVRDSVHFIVSGAGAKRTSVKRKGYAKFVAGVTGFVQTDHYADGSFIMRLIRADKKHPDGTEIFQARIPPLTSAEK